MTRVVVEITDHDGGASTDLKTTTASDEFSSENEKRWMKMLAGTIHDTLQRISREGVRVEPRTGKGETK